MKKYFLVIARYKNEKQELYDKYIEPKNKAYCLKHGFEYVGIKNDYHLDLVRGNPTWWKFSILKEWIDQGRIKQGDVFTHLDADMVIVKDDQPYQTDKSFSYSIDNGNTHCMGNYSMTINDWSIDLINRIMSQDLYEKLKTDQHWIEFREQACWYTLAGILPHSWVPFFDFPNYGFHSKKTFDTHYSLEDLDAHVEVRSPEWNTTLLSEEADGDVEKFLQKYNIVKSKKEDVIIRHFAGGQQWRKEYLGF